jgi:hypothetical protein
MPNPFVSLRLNVFLNSHLWFSFVPVFLLCHFVVKSMPKPFAALRENKTTPAVPFNFCPLREK